MKMEEKVVLSPAFKWVTYSLIAFGTMVTGIGLFTQPERTWANYLLNSFYFLSLAVGASFFYAIQYITQSGWSAGFKRIPEAIFAFIPYASVLFLLIYFGMHALYDWVHPDVVANDELLQHKAPYLNVPFFFIRLVLYFSLWIYITRMLRKLSLQEDISGGDRYFKRSELYSKVYIFVLAITFSLAVIDWIKSIDAHWFSTMFALKNFISAFVHGVAALVVILFVLNSRGHFSFLNKSHVHDFNRYLFILSVFYGYFWFSQFMLIWFANIPEETVYYHTRLHPEWRAFWIADIVMNWLIPFLVLLPPVLSRRKNLVLAVAFLLLLGFWIDLFVEIMPGVTGSPQIGFIEAGMYLGFAGLFALVTGTALSKAALVPRNHPYLEESTDHHF
jgi:hypothetical protein